MTKSEAYDILSKKILDASCGSRMIWFDKENPYTLYVDRRVVINEEIWENGKGVAKRFLTVNPDIIADFTNLPFEDESFYLVVFDPPHLIKLGESSWLCKKYGKLGSDWKRVIHDGFAECMRVLKPNGTLVFKWSEYDIPVKDIIKAIGQTPLFGNRSGKSSKTHWMCFLKCGKDV